jgi:D-3-phosphoglycerate dehydrogenase
MTCQNHKKLLFLEPFSENLTSVLRQHGYKIYNEAAIPDSDFPLIRGLFTKLDRKVDDSLLRKLSNLRFVVVPTTGTSHLDRMVMHDRNIQIISLRDPGSPIHSFTSTSEVFLWLLISMLRKANLAAKEVSAGTWNRNNFIGTNIAGKKIGIVGLGRLGRQVANLCRALGMIVIGYDIDKESKFSENLTFADNLEELIAKAEIISIHVDDREENKNLINDTFLLQCHGTLLVNTSRGFITDESAVVRALKNGNLCGYATDVLFDEGATGNWLHRNPIWQAMTSEELNVVITPHIGGATQENIYQSERFVIERFLKSDCIHGSGGQWES